MDKKFNYKVCKYYYCIEEVKKPHTNYCSGDCKIKDSNLQKLKLKKREYERWKTI